MDFDDLLNRYFGTSDLAEASEAVQEAGLDRLRVDFGLETDRGRKFALWSLLYLLGHAPDRREFFRRMSQGYRRHGSGVSLGGGRLAGVRTALIARDLHAGYRLLEAALAKRRALEQRRSARAERRVADRG